MPLTTITLAPYAQGPGFAPDVEVNDPPIAFGGGSLSDGDDGTYLEMGAWTESTGSAHHSEPIATWFKTPHGFDPFAILLYTRVWNTEAIFGMAPDGNREVHTRLSSADNAVLFDSEIVSQGGGSPAVIADILEPAITTPTWLTWWAQANESAIDLANPSEAGGWYQLDWSFDNEFGDKEALTGDGLRLDVSISFHTFDVNVRYPWANWSEIRLLVAGHYNTGAPPCRLYPREDHLGVGSGRIWPPPKSHQASNRRAGGYY